VIDAVSIAETSLRQLGLCLLRQGGHVMPEDADANVVKIVIHEEGCIRLIVRQSVAELATSLTVEQFPPCAWPDRLP
jgi:hypothetical protein